MRGRNHSVKIAAALLALMTLPVALQCAPSRGGNGAANDKKYHWKPLPEAMLRLNSRPPKSWNIYRGEKGDKLLLVTLGKRVLIVEPDKQRVYQAPESEYPEAAAGAEFEAPGPVGTESEIPTTDWTNRDVGPAQLIRMTLGDYGQVLEMQIPHPIDIRTGLT